MAGNGDVATQSGIAAHVYRANRSMERRYLINSDGEMLLVPQAGALLLHTEMGRLAVAPGEIALIPRGLRFRAELLETEARGYLCENYGAAFRLPELGPIGSNGLANQRDFLAPVAACESIEVWLPIWTRGQGLDAEAGVPQEGSGVRRSFCDFFGRARSHQFPAPVSPLGSHIQNPVRRLNHLQVVLNNNQ